MLACWWQELGPSTRSCSLLQHQCEYAITGDGSGRLSSNTASASAAEDLTVQQYSCRLPLTFHSSTLSLGISPDLPYCQHSARLAALLFGVIRSICSNDLTTYHSKGLPAPTKQSHCLCPRVQHRHTRDECHLREADQQFSQTTARSCHRMISIMSLQLHHDSWYQVHSFQSWTHLS